MRAITVLLAALLFSQPVLAKTASSRPTGVLTASVPLLELPEGKRLKTPQGTFQGYNLQEFKIILRIEADYKSWGIQLPEYRKINKYLQQEVKNRDEQIMLMQTQMGVMSEDRERLFKKWKEENLKRHLAENKPEFGSWIAWGAAGVMTAVAAVLAGVLIARR